MAAPIQPNPGQLSTQPPAAPAAVAQPAPGGVGAAPTTMTPAAPVIAERGYFERAADAVADFFVRMYKAVGRYLGCLESEDELTKKEKELATLRRHLDLVTPTGEHFKGTGQQFLSFFRHYFSAEEQQDIYSLVGAKKKQEAKVVPGRLWGQTVIEPVRRTREENIALGQALVAESPGNTLSRYLIARLEELIALKE